MHDATQSIHRTLPIVFRVGSGRAGIREAHRGDARDAMGWGGEGRERRRSQWVRSGVGVGIGRIVGV